MTEDREAAHETSVVCSCVYTEGFTYRGFYLQGLMLDLLSCSQTEELGSDLPAWILFFCTIFELIANRFAAAGANCSCVHSTL